jgi:hypothetical protein
MDRDELDERIKSRRPGEGFRRGTSADEPPAYVPFSPEPEDALAARDPEVAAHAPRVDHVQEGAERWQPPAPPVEERWEPEPAPEPDPEHWQQPPQPAQRSDAWEQPVATPAAASYAAEDGAEDDYPDEAYGTPLPGYVHPYTDDDRRGGGGGALPIIGFVVLCVMALAVGAVLAGVFSGPSGVADASPTPEPTESVEPSVAPTPVASGQPSSEASATPEPTDGPVTFPDGAVYTVQPCATREMSFDGCEADGSSISGTNMWVWIGFDGAAGSDDIVLLLQSNGTTIDQQEKQLGSVVDCPATCGGYLIGAAYTGLDPGDYDLVVRRNGDFADRASFTVQGN